MACSLKIATWNVNSIRTRLSHVIDWLRQSDVDVLCLQETKVIDQDFPRQPLEDLGYSLAIAGQKSYNGVAILSRQPLTSVTVGFQPFLGGDVADLDDQKRVITGVLPTTWGSVRLVNLYVPNGSAIGSEKYAYKLRWLNALRDYLATLQQDSDTGNNLCVCGDFNIAPTDLDIYDAKDRETHIMASDAERIALQAAIFDLGLADGFRKFTQEGGHFSWWDYRTGAFRRNHGWRIDHLYVTPNLYAKTASCQIDPAPRKLTQPSDHAPVVLELDLQ